METGVKERLKKAVMERIDLSDEVKDEDVSELVDSCIVAEARTGYIPLKEKVELRNELFNDNNI